MTEVNTSEQFKEAADSSAKCSPAVTSSLDQKLDLILNRLNTLENYIDRNPDVHQEKLMEALEEGQPITSTDVQAIIRRSKPIALQTMQILARNNRGYILSCGISRYGYKIIKDTDNLKRKIIATFSLLIEQKKKAPFRVQMLDLPDMQKQLQEIFNEEISNDKIIHICVILTQLIPKLFLANRNDYQPNFENKFIIYRGGNLDSFKVL